MVLQAPSSAVVWGFAPAGARISVGFDGQPLHAVTSAADSVWRVKLPPTPASMTASHNITATSSGRTITLSDVLFGDVWVCSGQSNMQCKYIRYTSSSHPLPVIAETFLTDCWCTCLQTQWAKPAAT